MSIRDEVRRRLADWMLAQFALARRKGWFHTNALPQLDPSHCTGPGDVGQVLDEAVDELAARILEMRPEEVD